MIKRPTNGFLTIFTMLILNIAFCPAHAAVIYVDSTATGGDDGTSWSDAYTDLQSALGVAASGDSIWVAAGTYYPTSGSNRDSTFQLIDSVAVYGGFAGDEDSLSARDWSANVTILSGDIGEVGVDTDNSYHVVTGSGMDASAVLDGFTITQGNANGAGDDNGGGGMITVGGSPTIVNVIFTDNKAEFGGGMHNHTASTPTLTNVTFSGNSADHGAGMRNDGASHATLINVIFSGNTAASHGGGMHNDHGSNAMLTNVVFWGNSAVNEAGGMFNGVGSSPTLTNVTFSQNSADYGGGILNWDNSNPTLVNTILWGDSAGTAGDEIHNLTGSVPVVSYSLIEGGLPPGCTDGGNNVYQDPLFVGGPGGDLRLRSAASPAVNTGNNAALNLPATDLDGNPRVAAGTVDMGAYELQCPPVSIVYVDSSATGEGDGISWADAFTELRDALKLVVCPNVTEVWVAAGTYTPAAGTARDSTFQLVNGVAIYGGFAGDEDSLSARDWSANVTILSGDIGEMGVDTDNSYHVVTGSGTDASAVLDGFTITGGYADGSGTLSVGGGMHNAGGSPTIVNVTFLDNFAISYGGGMKNDANSNPRLTNVVFSGNSAGGDGGGINNDSSAPALINVVFTGNSANGDGGGMVNYLSSPALTNVTFSGNSSDCGGGMYNQECNPTLVNTILWGDSAGTEGDEIYNTLSAPVVSYSLIEGGLPSGCTDGGNNVYQDPLFVDGSGGDLRLSSVASAAFNSGSNAAPNLPATDLDGNPRIANGIVDMGAYELQGVTCPPGNVLYVDSSATGAGDGTSWTDAFTELRDALKWVQCPTVTEVWVAAGTYTPASGSDSIATFQLVDSVAVYGGFAGDEDSLSARDWSTNVTILSGDVGTPVDSTDNSYHVVTGSGTDASAVLDGFTITQGNADGAGTNGNGGGMFTQAGSPTISNVIFSDNQAFGGGAMYNTGSSPTLTNVIFSGNTASIENGGGMYNNLDSSPTLTNVTFSNNSAETGGGMSNLNGSNPTLTNVTFSNNSADYGGGMLNNLESNPTLVNTILWGDSAGTAGDEIYNMGSQPVVSYSLIEGGLSPGCTDGGNNVYQDPLFVDGPGGDLRLSGVASAAFNSGSNDAPNLPATDLDGNPRIANGIVDMGAYEYPAACPPGPVVYVDSSATGAGDGTSWADAFTDLQTALGYAKCPNITEVWVAAGTYTPTSGSSRIVAFQLVDSVAVYGGFAGDEDSLSERDWLANVTILSGGIGEVGVDTDNSYHVVTGSGTDASAVLDGFTITGGYADGTGTNGYAGGMYNAGGSPTISNVIFCDNHAFGGGAMYNSGSNPTLTNVTFSGNSAAYGGGVYNLGHSNATLTNVTFSGNSADYGGGMRNDGRSNATLTNVTFSNNSAAYGGGVYNLGHSNATLTNVTFSGNSADYGGGMLNNLESYPTLVNTILWGDSAGTAGDEIHNWGSEPVVSYSLIEGGLPPGCTDGGNNVYQDPLFVDEPGGDLRLSGVASAAFNSGSNAAPNLPATDLDGNPRIVGGTVDMGAYEYQAVASASAYPSPLVFAEVPFYYTTCDTIYVVNEGGDTCTVAGIYGCTTAPFSMDTTMTAHTLAPGDTTEIVVCVTPTAADPDTAEVTIVSDAWNSPTTVQVRIDVVTAVGPDRTPKPFRIVSVVPNPFNPSTTVHFTLPAAIPVTAVVYSVTGARVRGLARNERFEPGDNRLMWDGRTDGGSPAASGVYFIRIETRLGAKVARAVLLK